MHLDGKIKQAPEPFLKKFAPGHLKGKGVFETLRACRGRIAFVDEHRARLFSGLKILKIRTDGLDFSKKKFCRYLYDILKANRLQNARLRLTVWQEKKRRRVCIICLPFKPPSPRRYRKGFAATIFSVPYRRKIPLANIKSIDYRFFAEAYKAAQRRGYDEAIVRNHENKIVEGSRSNIFFVKDGMIFTPALSCGCLAGVTRGWVLKLASRRKIPVKTISATVEKLYAADEIFLTNSLIALMPLTRLDRRPIGSGKAGPIVKILQAAYRDLWEKEISPQSPDQDER